MIAYWPLLTIPIFALFSQVTIEKRLQIVILKFVGLLFILFIGFRHVVGGDWIPYIQIFNEVKNIPNLESLFLIALMNDIGYVMLNYFVNSVEGNIYVVNLLSAFIFVYGLWKFILSQENPWLVLLISIPFLIYIVAMGYTRQSIAVGLIFAAIVNLQEQKKTWYWIQLMLSVFFYKPAIIFLMLGIFSMDISTFKKYTAVLIFSLVSYYLLSVTFGNLVNSYVDLSKEHMVSYGAVPRVLMNAIPASILLLNLEKLQIPESTKKLFISMSWLILLTTVFVFFRSTPVDRIQVFLMPVQLLVMSRIAFLVRPVYIKQFFIVATVVLYITMLIVWLNTAKTRHAWIPYDNILMYL